MKDFQTALEIARELLKDHDNANRLYGQPNQDFYSIKLVADKGIDRRLFRIWYKNLKLEIYDAFPTGMRKRERVNSFRLNSLDELSKYSERIRRAADTYHFP